MANDINSVVLIGRFVRDPELKSTGSGGLLCRFTLASNRRIFNHQTGESRDKPGFFDCVIWGAQAETIHKYTQKGRRICVTGFLDWSKWEGNDGKKHTHTGILVETFQLLDTGRTGTAQGAQSGEPAGDTSVKPDADAAAAFDQPPGAMSDDDIPF